MVSNENLDFLAKIKIFSIPNPFRTFKNAFRGPYDSFNPPEAPELRVLKNSEFENLENLDISTTTYQYTVHDCILSKYMHKTRFRPISKLNGGRHASHRLTRPPPTPADATRCLGVAWDGLGCRQEAAAGRFRSKKPNLTRFGGAKYCPTQDLL